MTEDRPLSSDEMIRRAREVLSGPPEPHGGEAARPAEDPELAEDTLPTDITPRFSVERRAQRHKPLPSNPFVGRQWSVSPQEKAQVLEVISAITLLLLGIGIAMALFAANTLTA